MAARAALQGFAPVVDERITTLVLGSFPSAASLASGQYYGHPQNQFWRLVGAAIGEPLHEMEYAKRLPVLLAHGIGLWDVIGACERRGSLDSSIRKAEINRFQRVTRLAPNLRRICFNGKLSGRMEPVFADLGFETFVFPSSSPAYTLAFAEKLKTWKILVEAGIKKAPRRAL
jgi:hypoxanthine-DNA glycosylase